MLERGLVSLMVLALGLWAAVAVAQPARPALPDLDTVTHLECLPLAMFSVAYDDGHMMMDEQDIAGVPVRISAIDLEEGTALVEYYGESALVQVHAAPHGLVFVDSVQGDAELGGSFFGTVWTRRGEAGWMYSFVLNDDRRAIPSAEHSAGACDLPMS